ncbi:succinic semialdehyde dehydrogenase [Actinophytocola gossypii]|uniref:Succinate-semialdehyde dehydrogenase (NADP(+)) n=1 Tax=Actinophytocola gossypii TaxID=2812003 RepID=A0ABT2J4S2_9PSEU|nr:succinic semialdehyde dehydrogenase [Actinophytocola gossypii]MCT2582783.1 succinate-semialdehyde dehydrogenase (NADP(+)) [Actinophytocola gossypii]
MRPPSLTDELLDTLRARVTGSGGTHTTTAVFTGGDLATVPESTPDDVHAAVEHAARAQRDWAATPLATRLAVFERFHRLLLRHRDTVADLLQAETGKARRDAFEEFAEPALVTSHYLRTAPGLLRPRRRAGALPGAVSATELRHPKGVVGIIAPWNYPFALSIGDLVPALVAGNAVVLKPDRQTPLSPLFGVELLYRAGLPAGLLQVVLGDGPTVGGAVVDTCDYVGFTGSTRTGTLIAERAARRLIGCSLELGGKNPLLVLDDADIPATARAAVRGCFANAGQLCLSLERVYVHDSIFDAFADAFVAETGRLRLAAGYDYRADLGSLTSRRALTTVAEHVDDARAKGATVLAGGRPRPDLGPYFYEPTVLTDVTPDMRCHAAETFGPVVSLYPFDDDDEAVALANRTEYGLNASVFGRDRRRAAAVGARLRVGTVNVNDGYASAYGSTDAPMGGVGASGLGRRHGAEGLLKYTESQTVATQRVALLDPPRRLPYGLFAKAMTGSLRIMRALGIR